MTGAGQVLVAFASVAALLALMALVRFAASRRDLGAEVQRKLVHIGTGLYALGMPWLFADDWPVYMLIGLTLAVMTVLRLPGIRTGGIGEALHGVERQSYGDFLLALAVGVAFLLSDGQAILYVLPLAILTLSDAAAALTGSRYGRVFFAVEDGRKSVEGSAVFFLVSLILAMICLLLLSDIARPNVIVVALIVAAFGTLVEAESWRGFDNFFLPAGLLVFLQAHMNSPAPVLVAVAAAFGFAIWAAHVLAARHGGKAHEARLYVISAFLLYSVTAPHNTVLPLLALLAHAFSNAQNPCAARHPVLDVVAAVALLSFGWLTLGLVTGLNALGFYAITSMALAAGLVALGLGRRPLALRIAAAVLVAGALFAAFQWLIALNTGASGWAGDLRGLGLGALALVLAPTLARPGAFLHDRVLKLTALSLLCPVAGYLWMANAAGWPG